MLKYFQINFYYRFFKGQEQETIILFTSIIGIIFLSAFALVSFFNNNFPLVAILSISLSLGVFNVFYLLKQKNIARAQFNLAIISILLCLGLLISGGKDNTGILWTYPIIAIALSILNVENGKKITLFYLLISIVIFSVSNNIDWIQSYSFVTSSRYIFSLIALSITLLLLVKTQEDYNHKLRKRAITDTLTRVYNRAVIKEASFRQEQRASVDGSYIILLDIDNFKSINDQFGHDAGDQTLVEIALELKQQVRKSDYIIRWGGEEFLLCLNNYSFNNAYNKAEEIRQSIKKSSKIKQLLGTHLTVSIGIAKVIDGQFDKSITDADNKLFQSKHAGKDRITS